MGQSYLAIAFGETLLVGVGATISADGQELLKLTASADGELELSIDLRDRHGNSLAVIEKNIWVSGDPSVWDMKSDHDRLKIWSTTGKIALELDARRTPTRIRAELWHSHKLVQLNNAGFSVKDDPTDGAGIGMKGLGLVGMSLNVVTATGELEITPIAGEGYLVSEPEPTKRLVESLDAWQQLSGSYGKGASLR